MDFTYEDLHWMYNLLSTTVTEKRLDAKIDGELMYVLAVLPAKG